MNHGSQSNGASLGVVRKVSSLCLGRSGVAHGLHGAVTQRLRSSCGQAKGGFCHPARISTTKIIRRNLLPSWDERSEPESWELARSTVDINHPPQERIPDTKIKEPTA